MTSCSSLSSRKCAFEYFFKQLEQAYLSRPTEDLGIDSILVCIIFDWIFFPEKIIKADYFSPKILESKLRILNVCERVEREKEKLSFLKQRVVLLVHSSVHHLLIPSFYYSWQWKAQKSSVVILLPFSIEQMKGLEIYLHIVVIKTNLLFPLGRSGQIVPQRGINPLIARQRNSSPIHEKKVT